MTDAARWRALPLGVVIAVAASTASAQAAVTSQSAHVQATVVNGRLEHAAGDRPVRDRRMLVLTVAEGWHIYGTRSGTSGIPTQLQWTVASPARITAVQWPKPATVVRGRDTTFEYEGEVTVPFTIETTGAPKTGRHAVDISLGVCREICLPERLRVVFRSR